MESPTYWERGGGFFSSPEREAGMIARNKNRKRLSKTTVKERLRPDTNSTSPS